MSQTPREKSETLLDLLKEYLRSADMWEEYYVKAANKEFDKGEDRRERLRLQTEYMIPLMEKCRAVGVRYATLLEIIPGAFKTTSDERWAIFDVLYVMAGSK